MPNPPFPDPAGELSLAGPVGRLQVVVDAPDADVSPQPVVAIVCHPLPTEGGTLNNKVVTMAARALRELGVTTVRFNFRGTGQSEGEFDNGRGEGDDLRSVADWVRTQRPDAALWLAGFSFGAFVSVRMAAELQPALLLSIAPPADRGWGLVDAPLPDMPWIVIQGEADEIVSPQAVYNWLDALPREVLLLKLPDTSHFFHGKLVELRELIRLYAKSFLPDAAA